MEIIRVIVRVIGDKVIIHLSQQLQIPHMIGFHDARLDVIYDFLSDLEGLWVRDIQ